MQTFLISMETPAGQTRRRKMMKRCHQAGLRRVEWVHGVDGRAIQPEILPEIATPLCATFCTPGMVGCAMSHVTCWREVVRRKLSHALILEDDAIFVPHFARKLDEAMRSAPPDFHILLAGCFLCADYMQRMCHGGCLPIEGPQNMRNVGIFAGTHAYIVTQEGAQFLLRHIPPIKGHIDMQMSMLDGLRVYRPQQLLAVQEDMATSSIAKFGFPGTLNGILASMERPNYSPVYTANSAMCRLGPYAGPHIVLTPWHVVLAAAGGAGVPWQIMAVVALVDVLLVPPTLPDLASKMGAFAVGLASRAAIQGFVR